MLSHAYSLNECKGQARFCLRWGLVSSLGTVLGIVGGIPTAIFVGFLAYILLTLNRTTAPFVYAPSMAAVGAVTGAVVGIAQAGILAWPEAARRRWIAGSAIGWGIGAGLGAFVAILNALPVRNAHFLIPTVDYSLVMVIMTPILGLIVGLALRPALPAPAPNLVYWLIVNIFAASFGWIAAWWIVGTSGSFFGVTWAGLVLGPLVYAMVTGTMMLALEHRRLIADRGDESPSSVGHSLSHLYAWPAWASDVRFWLRWVLVNTVLSALGYGGGLFTASVLGVLLGITFAGAFAVLPASAVTGAIVGALVGTGQSLLLSSWTPDEKSRWQRRNLLGWTLGAVSGLVGSAAILVSLSSTGILRGGNEILGLGFVLAIALGGIVIGLVLWPALPSPAPALSLWLTLHVAATSLGWLAAWLIAGSSTFVTLSVTALILGPLIYATISGAMMVWIEHRRLAQAERAT